MLYVRGTRLAVAATSAVTLSAMIFARPLLRCAWGGGGLCRAGQTVKPRLYLVYPILVSIHVIGLTMLVGLGRLRQVATLSLCSVGLNLVLSIVLVRQLGLIGVVWGTTIGYLVLWVPYLRIMTRELGVRIGEFLASVIWPVTPGILAQVGVGLVMLRALPADPGLIAVLGAMVRRGEPGVLRSARHGPRRAPVALGRGRPRGPLNARRGPGVRSGRPRRCRWEHW